MQGTEQSPVAGERPPLLDLGPFDELPELLLIHGSDIDMTLVPEPLIKTAFLMLGQQGRLDLDDAAYERIQALNQPGSQIECTRAITRNYPRAVAQLSASTMQRTAAAVAEQAEATIYAEVQPFLDEARREGRGLVLISSAPALLVAALGNTLGALRAEGRQHIASGWLIDPLDKGRRFVSICRELGGAAATALGDSLDDAPMLDVAQKALAVNPQPELRVLAQAKGWSIIDCAAYDSRG